MANYGPGGRPDRGHRWRKMRDQIARNRGACHLCGKSINYDLKYPHPMAFTVDHIQPVSMVPELAFSLENCRPAHKRCNEVRGTGKGRTHGGVKSEDW